MGWLGDIKKKAKAEFEEQALAFGKEKGLEFLRSHFTLESLPKLKRVFLLCADPELAESSWKRLEAVVTKYGDPNFKLIGRANITPEIEEKIRAAVHDVVEVDQVDFAISYDIAEGTEDYFTISGGVWENGFITGPLRKFVDDGEIIEKIFNSLTRKGVKPSDSMFYLNNLAPILVLYFCLCLLGHKERIYKLDPLFELLALGVVPYRTEKVTQISGPNNEICANGEGRICVMVDRVREFDNQSFEREKVENVVVR
ncbi:MAG: hypothetical protein HY225_00610 [Candidatus Vogelbacteria bacterium]|nr:hypothetical protein [Candidatus Vogelbacteria bacterium]